MMMIQASIVDLSGLPPGAEAGKGWRRESSRIYDFGRSIGADVVYLVGSRGLFMVVRVAPEVQR